MIDLLLSAVALIGLSPACALIAVLIRRDSPGPVLYRQIRRGRGDSTFMLLKFRTMVEDADARLGEVLDRNLHAAQFGDVRMYKIAEDPRVTRFGALLRRHSLDELPQLLNVLRGEMSLVGPRPLILAEDAYVPAYARSRRTVRPGVTGPWQVSGRNDLSFEQMLELDCAYVRARKTTTDLKVLARTIPVVVKAQPAC